MELCEPSQKGGLLVNLQPQKNFNSDFSAAHLYQIKYSPEPDTLTRFVKFIDLVHSAESGMGVCMIVCAIIYQLEGRTKDSG
jgi:hypothetical protein